MTPNRFEYYEYILIVVDQIIHISHDTGRTINTIDKLYELKHDSIVKSKNYLGAHISTYQMENDTVWWYMSVYDCVKFSDYNIDKLLKADRLIMVKCDQVK